ncbi:50S ribosomal protein L5, partial [Candidatus Beckwithbacteria bacterium RBG_13_35_6]
MNRLQEKYQKQVIGKIQQEFSIENCMAVPRIIKVVINVGIGDLARESQPREKAIA